MKIYQVTTIDRAHQRHSKLCLARSWYQAWRHAADRHGLAVLVMVKPCKPRHQKAQRSEEGAT